MPLMFNAAFLATLCFPVIKLEFTKDEFQIADNLREYIATGTNAMAEQYQIELNAISHNQRFDELVVKLYQQTGQPVVL